MPKTHPPYAAEYRRRLVELARSGRPLTALAREFEPTVETKFGAAVDRAVAENPSIPKRRV